MSDGMIALLSAIGGGLIAAISSYAKNKSDERKTKIEGEANTEGIYVQNMSLIIEGYKEQVSGFRDELTRVRSEFEDFKKQHSETVENYRGQIVFLKLQIESKDERIEELEEAVMAKDIEIAFLKGEE